MNDLNASICIEQQSYVRPGTVLGRSGPGRYRIALDGREQDVLKAQSALAVDRELGAGTRVLVTGESGAPGYIIGVLPGPDGSAPAQELRTRSGAAARIVERDGGERIRVQGTDGCVLFEYDPQRRSATLSMPDGDLTLAAPRGNVNILSGGDLLCSSVGATVVRSARSVDLGVHGSDPGAARIKLSEQGLALSGDDLRVDSTTADVRIENARYRGTSFQGTLGRARWVYDRLETVVTRLFERARNVYRYTEQLHQTKAGRVRTIVAGDYRVRGKRIDLGAQADVKIDGERINLG